VQTAGHSAGASADFSCSLLLLRRKLESMRAPLTQALPRTGTAELRTPIPPDDRDLFLAAGQDCLRLAAMAQGLAALEAEERRAIAERP
jgi:hypothetical protein